MGCRDVISQETCTLYQPQISYTTRKGAVKKQRQDRRGHSEKGGLFKLREREGKRAQKSKPGVKPAEKDGE